MNEYAAFILAIWAELEAGFPGWKPPLKSLRTVENAPNPFCPGEVLTYSTYAPIWLEPATDVMPINRSWWQNHEVFDGGALTNVEFEALVEIVLGRPHILRDVLFSNGIEFLVAVPDELVEVIVSKQNLDILARQWAEAMSDPKFGTNHDGQPVYAWFNIETAIYWLNGLFDLARMRKEGESLFLYYEQ